MQQKVARVQSVSFPSRPLAALAPVLPAWVRQTPSVIKLAAWRTQDAARWPAATEATRAILCVPAAHSYRKSSGFLRRRPVVGKVPTTVFVLKSRQTDAPALAVVHA